MENPFKFGSVVEAQYFTDRRQERDYLLQILQSPNHAVLISPRRFGKSSLVQETLRTVRRPRISLNLQAVTSTTRLAEALLRRVFALYPYEKVRHYFSHFRLIPTFSVNPVTGTTEVSFHPDADSQIAMEDVFDLLEKLGKNKRLIVILDEFKEILKIDRNLDSILRSIMQEQQNINYVLMGSQEDMMKKIFERKKSPFYHFGALIRLDKIPYEDFFRYLSDRFGRLPQVPDAAAVSDEILRITSCHPYYTQQLAFQTWYVALSGSDGDPVGLAAEQLVRMHDFDYERLWDGMNMTNRAVLMQLATSKSSPLGKRSQPTSTVFSALKRLIAAGIVIKLDSYEIDDPFFARWIRETLNSD